MKREEIIEVLEKHLPRFDNEVRIIDAIADELEQQAELCDILNCISKFDSTESLENKGRYFEVIQKDIRKYLCPPE